MLRLPDPMTNAMSSDPVYVHDALRSPRGKARADGGLAQLTPQELVRQAFVALDERVGGGARTADALILGCVGQIGAQGGNIALVSKLHAGLRDEATAYALNNYCVSSLTAIGQAATMVASGQADRVLAGGVEMMSRVPFMADTADYYTDAAFPYFDAFVTVSSIVTTYMVARKILENWVYWLVVDSLSMYLYLERGLYLYAGLFALYLVLVVIGLVRWHRDWRAQAVALA